MAIWMSQVERVIRSLGKIEVNWMQRNSGKLGGPRPGWLGWSLRVLLVLGLAIGAFLAGVSPANAGQASASPPPEMSSPTDVEAAPTRTRHTHQLPPKPYKKAVPLPGKK